MALPFLGWWRRLRRERGQALVEMAFIAPVLIFLVLGLINIGDGVNAYISVVNTAREGARFGSQGGTDGEIAQLVVNEGERLRGGSGALAVAVNRDPLGEFLEVEVCYEHPMMVALPLFTAVVDNPVHMCSTTRMPLIGGLASD